MEIYNANMIRMILLIGGYLADSVVTLRSMASLPSCGDGGSLTLKLFSSTSCCEIFSDTCSDVLAAMLDSVGVLLDKSYVEVQSAG